MRNAQLEPLDNAKPKYLAESKITLVNQTSKNVNDEAILQENHHYLTRKYNLLRRVIAARKLHHGRFFRWTWIMAISLISMH